MSKLQGTLTLGMLALVVSGAWAQDTPAPASGNVPNSSSQPVAPFGQDSSQGPDVLLPPIVDNPPISGLDQPGLEPHAAPLSYLKIGATVAESADSNAENTVGGGTVHSLSRALGSATLQRLWRNYDLAVDYVGGVGYYSLQGQGFKALQQLDLDQKITWKRGQLSLRDNFSYLPEGNFGGAYGSLGPQAIASVGNNAFGSFWGGTGIGSLGLAPRILNVSLVDVTEDLTPKSAVTAAGGYAFTHFYGNDATTGTAFIGSSEVSAQVGYNRILTPHTQVALVYGYQGFDFSVFGSAFHSHIVEAMYGHRISGRLDFLIGAGPQVTLIDEQSEVCSDPTLSVLTCGFQGGQLLPTTIKDTKLGVSGRALLRYKLPKTSLALTYERFLTSGSGLFAGTQSDIATLSAERPLSRVWGAVADIGYAHNSRVQPLTAQQVQECLSLTTTSQAACPANDARSYNYGFIGGALHRSLGRNFDFFVSYQFNELAFNSSFCLTGTNPCSRIGHRHIATFGLDWTPRPIRID
jgi:hypothetical protein